MAVTRNRIQRNLDLICKNIEIACARSRRHPEEVSLVAITKSVDMDTIRNLLDVGLTDLGESRVQQLVKRSDEMDEYLKRRRNELRGPVRWHLVGHLQRNKINQALKCASYIHSVDSLRLAEELNTRAQKAGRTVDVFLQVNSTMEEQKHGCAVGAALHLGESITTLKNLRLIGLMAMGKLNDEKETRLSFGRLRELFEEMKSDKVGGPAFRHLSMGMSDDYVIAVEEGATVLRIGSALFQ
jgi:PLP dependent protein